MHPADELAEVKAQLKLLKSREAALGTAFLEKRVPPASRRFAVQIREQRRLHFLRDKLPEHVLEDPHFWETRVSRVLTLRDRRRPVASLDDVMVIEA